IVFCRPPGAEASKMPVPRSRQEDSMAKRKKAAPALRRTCGAMAAHMALLEQYPAFRANQMRLEGATSARRDQGIDLKKAKIVTIKTVVNVVYNTDAQNISQAQINSQIKALNRDFAAT